MSGRFLMPDLAVIINTCKRHDALQRLIVQLKPKLNIADSIFIVNDGDQGDIGDLNKESIFIIDHCKDYYALASGRNRGIKRAIKEGYEWGILLDDDNQLMTNIIEEHRQQAQRVDNDCLLVGKAVNEWSRPLDIRQKRIYETGQNKKLTGEAEIKTVCWNLSFHLPTVQSLGSFDEKFDGHWGAEDNEFYYRLKKQHEFTVKYLPNAVVYHDKLSTAGEHYQRQDSKNKKYIPKEATYNANN